MPLTLDVVIPLDDRLKYTKEVFADIIANTVHPNNTILIDNSQDPKTKSTCLLFQLCMKNVMYINNPKNIGVNASWNMGIQKSKSDLTCILNNDLVVHKQFFEKIIETFEQDPQIGIVVANTLGSPEEVRNATLNGRAVFKSLEEREGWAFTLRSKLVQTEKPIPSSLFNFSGDDYLFGIVKRKGYTAVKAMDAIVHHITAGVSFRSVHNKAEAAKAKLDHEAWKVWKRENGW